MPAFDLHGTGTVSTRPERTPPLDNGPRYAAGGAELTPDDINDMWSNLRNLLAALDGDPDDDDDALKNAVLTALAARLAEGETLNRLEDGDGFVRMTDAERAKLAALYDNFKGVYADLATLAGAVAGGSGFWSILTNGSGGVATFAAWDSDSAVPQWIDTGLSLPASMLKSDTTANLTKGYTATAYPINGGSAVTTGTITPDPANGNLQRYINGGAHTLAAPTAAGDYTITTQITNNGSAGAVTLSGFTKTSGDSLTTTNGHHFLLHIIKLNGFTRCYKEALQ